MDNPFIFREMPLTAPFCNRQKELKELYSHAANRANVVLISPRRYGKTSLVKRIQAKLQKEGVVTIYVDFFGVDSVEDVAGRLAARLFAFFRDNEGLFKKIMRFLSSWRPVIRPDYEYGIALTVEPAAKKRGMEMLADTMEGLSGFIRNHDRPLHIVLDEFQEIVELRESLMIEGVMRTTIQSQARASYFFVGSRRRMLSDIFNESKRPFYRSSINYVLDPLPFDESAEFIVEQFKKGRKRCPLDIAKRIVEKVRGYPYYVQRIPYSIYEVSSRVITEDDYRIGFVRAIEEERLIFEAMLQSLAPQQIKLLVALAIEPTDKLFSSAYMARYNLGSVGGIQGAIQKLISLDYIEKKEEGYRLVDPVFGIWLKQFRAGRLDI